MKTLPALLLACALLAPASAMADAAQDSFRAGVEAAEREDFATAAEHWRSAARMDHADAAFRLGTLYAEGQGVEQDPEQALHWYRQAADAGSTTAQFNLGHMYATGDGVPVDADRAARWYTRAARSGDAYAQYTLGNLYNRGGTGLERDLAAAWFWLTLAADNFGPNAFRDNANQLRRQAWDRMDEAQRSQARQRLEDWKAEQD